MWRGALVLLSVSVWLCPQVHGYFTSVDAHAEECFFDRVSSGMKMSLTFEVVEGGFLDIDVKVRIFSLSYVSSAFIREHQLVYDTG